MLTKQNRWKARPTQEDQMVARLHPTETLTTYKKNITIIQQEELRSTYR